MLIPIPRDVIEAVKSLVQSLVDGRISSNRHFSRKGSLAPRTIASVLAKAQLTLAMPPAEFWNTLEAVPVENARNSWAIDVDVWSTSGERSDLTLQLAAFKRGNDIRIEVWDFHVL